MFLAGAALAALVGGFVHYLALTSTGNFMLLAVTILPVCLLAALGQAKGRSAAGAGYGILVLDVIGPTNPMQYPLDETLNTIMADLCGLALAVVAFTSLPPPASAPVRQKRVMLRMQRATAIVSFWPAWMLSVPEAWLSRMFDRIAKLQTSDPSILHQARIFLLTGTLLLALRRGDDALGRRVGRLVWTEPSIRGPALRALAGGIADGLQRSRILALSQLIEGRDLNMWPEVSV
jgi:uncharacterized membrane protein YccC